MKTLVTALAARAGHAKPPTAPLYMPVPVQSRP
jgi:hypothetical protein